MENGALEQMGLIIEDWIPKEASIAVARNGQYIYYKAGIHDVNICNGEAVEAGGIVERTYIEEKRVEMLVERSRYGASYYGIGYPVKMGADRAVLVVILPPDFPGKKKAPVSFLTGRLEEVWRPVPVDKVSHIESSQKKTWFYAGEEAYYSIHTLKNLRHRLPDVFLQIHRSYIVNIHFIEEISRGLSSNYELTLKDGSILPIGQNFAGSVREHLGF